jgi:outer membrane protein assembly factor BamE (lipoprotein component of BamABCDE complex)
MRNFVLLCVGVLALTACSPKVHHQGKAVEQSEIEKIKVNQHTKEDVANLLGSPSMQSMFADDRWYYCSKTTETTAFMKPVAAEQNVYVVNFDKTGRVASVKHLDLENSQSVSYVNRETPTTGQDTSMLQQLFGNFGRISRSDKMDNK